MRYSYSSSSLTKSDPPKESGFVKYSSAEDSTSDRSPRSFQQSLHRLKSHRKVMKNIEFYGFEAVRASNGYMKSIQRRAKKWTIEEKERFIEELKERLETEESVFDFLLLFDGRIRVKRNYHKRRAKKKARETRTGTNGSIQSIVNLV
jgi:hypothetical protein